MNICSNCLESCLQKQDSLVLQLQERPFLRKDFLQLVNLAGDQWVQSAVSQAGFAAAEDGRFHKQEKSPLGSANLEEGLLLPRTLLKE